MSFYERLDYIVKRNNSCVCVGLDSNLDRIPPHLRKDKTVGEAIFEFNRQIIETTADLICAYKPNLAFYEAQGPAGLRALKRTLDFISDKYPDVLKVADAKRGDIGSTNEGYTRAIFDYFGFDAVTLHPYLGREALEPFLAREDKGLIILCRTSNPGAGELQDLISEHPRHGRLPLYKWVAHQVAEKWNENKNCCLVVGATYPEELREVRAIAAEMPFLIPGIGAQGGDVEKTVKAGQNSQGRGMIINSSRGIIFVSDGKDFAQVARQKTKELKEMINQFRRSGD